MVGQSRWERDVVVAVGFAASLIVYVVQPRPAGLDPIPADLAAHHLPAAGHRDDHSRDCSRVSGGGTRCGNGTLPSTTSTAPSSFASWRFCSSRTRWC